MSTSARPALTRERILQAGVDLADTDGLTGLSMRKLAGNLGYEVMSLYNHVANKEDLREGMLDLVCAGIDEPPPDAVGWRPALRHVAIAAHEALLAHPWAGELWPRVYPGPIRWRYMELVLELLKDSGLTGHDRDVGFHAVTLHITGFTQQQLAYAADSDDSNMVRAARDLAAKPYPLMLEHLEYHQHMDAVPGDRPDSFQFVLDLILDGLDRMTTDG